MNLKFTSTRKKKKEKTENQQLTEQQEHHTNNECAVVEYTDKKDSVADNGVEKSDIETYRPNVNDVLAEKDSHLKTIDERLKRVNDTLNRLQKQELFMDQLISDTLDRIAEIKDPKQFKKKSQLQSIFMRQSEAQTLLIDAINKQENLIKQYLDAKRKIENDHFKNYKTLNDIKLEDAQQSSLSDMLQIVERFFIDSTNSNPDKPDLMEIVEAELLEDNG